MPPGQHVPADLQFDVGDDGGQVGVAAALADAVDGALDVVAAFLDGSEGVGDGEAGVVVDVDAEGRGDAGAHGADDLAEA